MKIGQFSDTFYPVVDGVGRVVCSYANHLARMGHEVYVVTPMADTGYRGGLPYELVDFLGFAVPGSPQYKAGLAIADPHYMRRMEHIKFDVVHAHTPFFSGEAALRAAIKNDCPLVGTFHSKYYDDFYKATGAAFIAHLGVKFVVDYYEHCDEVWAVSALSAETLRSYGYSGEIHIAENGTDVRPARPEDQARAAEQFGLGAEPVLLFVGQINWKKNILNILEAAAALKAQGQAFRLVLAGQGPDREAIERKAQELGVGERTVFTGHVTDVALLDGLYQCASLFVFPSIYDNAPMVLREAAAMGTPAVLTRGCAAAEVVQDGVSGYLAEDDAQDLARVIRGALSDSARLAAVGGEAQRAIPVAWEDILPGAVSRYEELIANYRSTRHRHLLPRISHR